MPLAELRRSFAGPGRLDWIGLRPMRKSPMTMVDSTEITSNGLTGDHGRSGKRAVTIIQAEHFAAVASMMGLRDIAPDIPRRNLVISGINLTALREFGLRIGSVRLAIAAPCAPCTRMERALGPGGYNALRGHGGWCCAVLEGGRISVGDRVSPDL